MSTGPYYDVKRNVRSSPLSRFPTDLALILRPGHTSSLLFHYPSEGTNMETVGIVVLVVVGIGVSFATLLYLIGRKLPRHHEERQTCELDMPVPELWRKLTDFARFPEWQPWLKRVERLRG